MGTFHSMFARILRIDCGPIGYTRTFSIYDTADSAAAISARAAHLSASRLQGRISAANNRLVSAAEYARTAVDDLDAVIAEVYAAYDRRLKESNALDFDDLLLKPVELFDLHRAVLEKYRERFHFLLVDEYQDTNRVQYELLKRLAGARRNIFVVGDDAQSIYSFRGADIRNILEFGKDFPDALVIRLEQNYRSTANILGAADAVIKQNGQGHVKHLWTENPAGEPIRLMSCADDRAEAEEVASVILNSRTQTASRTGSSEAWSSTSAGR
jgi:DNA helicase-2/ATP-dependent DNA helicase PcrA